MKQSTKKLQEYHDKNPYAASHPYAKGRKLKPEGAPVSAKSKALKKKKIDMGKYPEIRLKAMEEAYKGRGKNVPLRYYKAAERK